MNELDVERTLNDEWQTFVASAQPNPELAVTTSQSRGGRITRPLLWAELEDVRLAFAELRRAIPDEDTAERLATTQWSVKDVVAHLGSWATEFRRQIETVAVRASFDYLITFTPNVGPTAWNERELSRRRPISLDDGFHELNTGTERIQELALSLADDVMFGVAELPQTSDGRPENRWRVRPADLILMKCWHDRYHLERLRAVLHLDAD